MAAVRPAVYVCVITFSRVVMRAVAELMDQMKCPVYLTSAKANVNVNEAFNAVMRRILPCASHNTQLVTAVLRFKRPIQSGWLTKKGKGGQLFARKNWCRRWSVLCMGTVVCPCLRCRFVLSDRYLTYQPDPDSKDIYGKIDVKQITDIVNGDDDVVCHLSCLYCADCTSPSALRR